MNSENVDMYYRFTSDLEPMDEQLAIIMREVGDDVRKQSKENAKKLLEKIDSEFQKAKKYYANC